MRATTLLPVIKRVKTAPDSCLGTQKVKLNPNKPPTFLLLYAITNEKTVKLTQIDRLLSASKTSPSETRSNNSGTLFKSRIP